MSSEREPNQKLSILLSAMLDGELTAAEETRLADLLRDNADAQDAYLDFCKTHALLRQELGGRCDIASLGDCPDFCVSKNGTVPFDAIGAIRSAVEMPIGLGEMGDRQLCGDDPTASVPFPSIVLQPGSDRAPLFSPLGGFAFSYALAALIIGVGLLIGWAYKVSNHEQIAVVSPPVPIAHSEPELVFVGRVTGLVDCQWSDSKTGTVDYAYVPLGRRYALASGLMEITYDSGATVILEGPCIYTVESKSGGYLGFGRLTAKAERRGEGRGERGEKNAANQQSAINSHRSPSPLSPLPSPLFTIRTPTAKLTDLGTEFGVAVNKSGLTESHVFRGRVLLAAVGGNGKPQDHTTTLVANESARIERAAGEALVVRRGKIKSNPASFVRGEQFAVRAKQVKELPLKPFRHWQAFSDQLRNRGDLLAYYDFQRDPGDPRDEEGYELLRNRATTGSKYDGRLVGSIKMGMARGRFPGKDALQFNYPGDGVRINVAGKFPRLTLVVSLALEQCNGLAGILMSDDWGQADRFHWQYIKLGTIKFAPVAVGGEMPFQFDCREAADLGHWHTWAMVYDAPAARVASYVDGRLLQEWKWADGPRLIIGEATIGNWKPLTAFDPRPLFGSIDEVTIFTAALGDAEIKRLQDGSGGTQQK